MHKLPKVKDYLAAQLDVCGKTQSAIARACGFGQPQMISMMKSGASRVPVNKIRPLAKALNVDPSYFFRLVIGEYHPDLLVAFDDLSDNQVLTGNELKLIRLLRSTAPGNPDPEISGRSRLLQQVFSEWKVATPVQDQPVTQPTDDTWQ